MQNFIEFIRKYNAVFWFFFLQLIAITLIFNYQPYHQSSAFNTSNRVSGSLMKTSDNFWSYFALRSVNDSLLLENALLYEMVFNAESPDAVAPVFQYSNTDSLLYGFIPANVIRNSLYKQRNFFTINKGLTHGIEKEMGVVSKNGVAGIVVDVSANYAVCISLLHSESRISSRLENSNYTGQLVWRGRSVEYAYLQDIPLHVNVRNDEDILTSGYSAIFPKGIPIGNIEEFHRIDGQNFWEIKVRLNTVFQSLDYVYVIKNTDLEELSELEEGFYAN